MAIEGLKAGQQPGEFNLSDHIGASVEALSMLGLVGDPDLVTESVANDYKKLIESGVAGEPYIQLPRSMITLTGLVKVLDSTTYPDGRSYGKSEVYKNLWTPGHGTEGYEADELDNLVLANLARGNQDDFRPHGRLAVHNTKTKSKKEPLLHFLGMPFDSKHARKGEQTQLEALDVMIKEYEAQNVTGDFEIAPLNAKAVAFMALVRRIKGEPMPLSWGFMRDATLPRKTVGGSSCVGDVDSDGGQLKMNSSYGYALSDFGVGVSMGPKNP